jgi:hypothetical protein
VVLKEGSGPVSERQLIEFARKRLPDFKMPVRIVFAETLAYGPTGKIDRKTSRDMARYLYEMVEARGLSHTEEMEGSWEVSVNRTRSSPWGYARSGSTRPRLRSITLLWVLLVARFRIDADMTTTPKDLVASTQDYPDKPVRMVEPFGTGGGPDLMARALAPKLSELWGQPVTVENLPGVRATAAPALVAQSRADGYTLLINTSAQAYGAALPRNLPYHPLEDFIPVAPLTSQPYVLVVGKPAGVTTMAELIAAAKAKPGELKFGYTGTGTGTHLAISKFNLEAGIMPTDVPPQTTDAISDGVTATIDGRITYMIAPISITLPPIRGGTVPAGWNHCETLDIASGGAGDR